jgi:2-oxoglutarate dehydrogenase E2 component (dihydrolipoamide succinyltransferase)
MPIELKVPEAGESISEVYIGSWLKQEGDVVAKDEPVVELETDKATLELPAPQAGKLVKLLKQAGDSAKVGEVIAHLVEEGAAEAVEEETGAPAEAEAKEDKKAEKARTQKAQEPKDDVPQEEAEEQATGEPVVMPAAQRLLNEHGLEASEIKGTGPGGRILKEDVQRQLQQTEKTKKEAPSTPKREAPAAPAPSEGREEERVPMSPLRRRIAERLVEAQQTAALLTTFNEIDMSAVIALRKEYQDAFVKRYDIKLGFMSFFVKATIDALKQFPQLNAYIEENEIVYHNYFDIGIAVSAKKGLIVPVIRNAERLSFAETEEAIADFGKRAQENKLAPEELQGGTFTISNGGIFGSLMSTPIVNPPQSGVLGMHAIQERPVAIDGQVKIRPMMYVALTYDHRIVDGREAVTFLRRIKEAIEAPTRMLLEV